MVLQNPERLVQIEQAVNRLSPSLLRVAYTYVHSMQDAEDIVQDVFLAYWHQAPVEMDCDYEKAWLLRVTINKSKDVVKSAWYRKRAPLEGTYEDKQEPTEETEVLEAVLSLDEKYRLPIHLYYYEGYSILEIAQLLDEKPATIGTRLSRGKDKLKTMIGEFRG